MTETEDYIERMPTLHINAFVWIVTLLFTFVIGGFLFIKRPDTVLGNIKLIAQNQPFELLAPYTGKLVLLKHAKDSVTTFQDVAYISNPTDYYIVQKLTSLLEERNYSHIYKELNNNEIIKRFGILNSSCMELRAAIYKYITFYEKSLYKENKRQLETEIAVLDNQINLQVNSLKIEQANIKVTALSFKEDSLLYTKKAITKTEFDRSFKTLLAQKEQYIETENNLLSYKREKATRELKLHELLVDNINNTETLQQEVERSITMLQNDIQVWRRQYVITSPIDGRLEVITSIEDKQIVKQDLPVIRILPTSSKIVGQILFTSKESGEVKDSSLVKIYLDSYSESQNGYLSGYITDISPSVYTIQDGESFHSAKVHINFNRQPYFHSKFQFAHGMTGRVEIIVKEKSMLMQILNIISANT